MYKASYTASSQLPLCRTFAKDYSFVDAADQKWSANNSKH